MNYAPVVVKVYDRPKHFKECIDSLAKNKGAENTILYISSDGPRDSCSAEKVTLVRDYIKTIYGFKKVVSFEPKENTNSEVFLRLYNEVKTNHARYVISEDDNIFSNFALNYFNQGLELFSDDPRVYAICGYIYPGFPSTKHEQIYLRCLAGWGAAFWRDKDVCLDLDELSLAAEVMSDKLLFNKISLTLPHMVPIIKLMLEGKLNALDVSICNYIVKTDKISVFPSISLVRNIGNDGTGEHCGINKVFEKQIIADQDIFFNMLKPREPVVDDEGWLTGFFGGKKAIIRSKLIFAEFNASNQISKFSYKTFLFMLRMSDVPTKLYRLARSRFT